jgi:hypothetical protein
MMKKCLTCVVAAVVALSVLMVAVPARAADAPKVSTFAPAGDLAGQVGKYVQAMKTAVADEQEYKDDEGKIAQNAATLTVIALALGLHDQDSDYKPKAAAIIKAAQDVIATKDYAAAKKAVDALEKVVEEKGTAGGDLKWEKVAPLPDLMKHVPKVNSKLKLYVKGKSFKKKAKDLAGWSAVIAVIARGTTNDTSATKGADQVKQWQKFSEAMRDAAGEVNTAIHKSDEAAAAKAMKKLTQSCDDCHAVFKPDVLGKTDE